MSRFYVGRRVSVVSGPCAGSRGTITLPAHADVQPILNWIVKLDEPVRLLGGWRSELGFAESALGPYTVPESARPIAVGALARGSR